jgi:hypothetical protein
MPRATDVVDEAARVCRASPIPWRSRPSPRPTSRLRSTKRSTKERQARALGRRRDASHATPTSLAPAKDMDATNIARSGYRTSRRIFSPLVLSVPMLGLSHQSSSSGGMFIDAALLRIIARLSDQIDSVISSGTRREPSHAPYEASGRRARRSGTNMMSRSRLGRLNTDREGGRSNKGAVGRSNRVHTRCEEIRSMFIGRDLEPGPESR